MKLYVWENHINSLEPLEFLHAPNLREINMGNLYGYKNKYRKELNNEFKTIA